MTLENVKSLPLKQIAELAKGTEPGSKSYVKSGKVRFIRVADLTGSRVSEIYVSELQGLVHVGENDILFSLDGTPGIVARGFLGAISSGVRKVSVLNHQQVLDDYLYYALQSAIVQEKVQRYSKGITIKHASSSLKHIKIPVPSISLQKLIVDKLQSVDKILAKQRVLMIEAAYLRKALVNKHFSLENAVKNNWKRKTLKEVCGEIYRYPTFYGFKFVRTGVPVVKISNFSENDTFEPDLTKYDYIPEQINSKFPKTILKHNDIVMGVRGTYVGKCVLVPSFLEYANISPNLIRIAPNREIIRPEFLWHFTYSDFWNQQVNKITYYWKQKFGTIRSSQLKEVEVPVPSLNEQDSVLQQMEYSLNVINEMGLVIRSTSDLLKSMIDSFIKTD